MGETDGGDPVFGVDGARLVLRPSSHHFRRLDPCTRCGRETVGSPIVTRRDLHVPGDPVVCQECVGSAQSPQADDRFGFDGS